MKRFLVLTLLAAPALLVAVAPARADFIPWDYNWTPSSTKIMADNPSQGAILLSNEPGGSGVGNTFIVATNIRTASTADPSSLATFTNKAYGLALTIVDDTSGKSGTMTFSGTFSGTVSKKSSLIVNNFTGPLTQSMQLGNHLYTVQIGPFAPPGPPTANIAGSISAMANVSVKAVPEPSTFVLSGLCLSLCGAGWWWRRARARGLSLDLT
jgi:hypothetical protein